jgi:hypothetical protein
VRLVVVGVDHAVVLVRAKLALFGRSSLQALLRTGICVSNLQCQAFLTDRNAMEVFDDFVANLA